MSIEEKIMTNLIEKFPDFKKSQCYEKEELTPYNVFGDFAVYIQDGLSASSISVDELKKASAFMNNMADSQDKYIQNLLVVGVFEVFTDQQDTVIWVRESLNENAVKLFEKTLRGWSD